MSDHNEDERQQQGRVTLLQRMLERSHSHRRAMDALDRVADGWERDAAAGRPPVLSAPAPTEDRLWFAERAEQLEERRREHLGRRARADREVAAAERLAQHERDRWPAA